MMPNQADGNQNGSPVQFSSADPTDRAELKEVMGIAPDLRGLNPLQVDALLSTAQIEQYRAQQVIGIEGTKAQRLYLVLKGEVAIFMGGKLREVVSLVGRGGTFGGNLLLGAPNVFSFGAERNALVASWSDETLQRAEALAPGLRAELANRLSKEARMEELADILQYAPLLRNTSSVLRYRLLQETTLVKYPAGSFIYEDGAPTSGCYLVVDGEVELNRATTSGDREKTALLGRGAFFGEIDLLTTGTRSESALATTETEVLAMHRMDIEALQRACGAFRYAIDARLGSGKPRSKPQDIFLVVNDTPYGTRGLASLLRSSLFAIDERKVAILEAVPEGSGESGEHYLQIPKDPDRALALVDAQVKQLSARYVIVFATLSNANQWLAEPMWDKIIDYRISSAVYFTSDMRSAFPIETPQLAPVQYVELRPSTMKSEVTTVRSGSIRIAVDAAPGSEVRFESLSAANRTCLHRLARMLTRQSVGVALGGGAAWGYAHIALLRGLVEAGIPIDMVSGTSIGAIVACVFASRGLEALSELERSGLETQIRFMFSPISRKPMADMAKRLMAHENLEDLPVLTFPVALDIQTGRARTFRHGPAIRAGLASSAVPVAIVPEILDGVRYLDGGMVNNVPVNCLVEEGADFIIASNIVPAPRRQKRETHKTTITELFSQLSPLRRLEDTIRAIYLLMRDAGTRQATAAHVTFTPNLMDFNFADFVHAKGIVAAADKDVPRFIEETKEKYKTFCRNRDY
jgi:predicted acylesterase/phospholipase RssA/CRP-like cAMP-binding protein